MKCPYWELFARGKKDEWDQWDNEVDDYYLKWSTYANHSQNTLGHFKRMVFLLGITINYRSRISEMAL